MPSNKPVINTWRAVCNESCSHGSESTWGKSAGLCPVTRPHLTLLLKMHISDPNIHHHPPCRPVDEMRRTILSAAGAAILALLAAIGSIVASVVR
jgi:hypothetical protein